MTDSRPLPPPAIVDRCARAYLDMLSEARQDYLWHTSDVRTAKPPAMGLALCRLVIQRGRETLRPLDLDKVLDELDAERAAEQMR